MGSNMFQTTFQASFSLSLTAMCMNLINVNYAETLDSMTALKPSGLTVK